MPARISTVEHRGNAFDLPLAANALIPSGNLVCLDAEGNALLAADAAGLRIAGVAHGPAGGSHPDLDADNTGKPAGKERVHVRQGIFQMRNSAAQPLSAADLGKLAFVEDERTLARESAHGVAAGAVLALEPGYVWLWIPCPSFRHEWVSNLCDHQPE